MCVCVCAFESSTAEAAVRVGGSHARRETPCALASRWCPYAGLAGRRRNGKRGLASAWESLDLLTFIVAKSVPACSRCGALYLVEAVSFLALLLTGALLLLFALSLHLRLPNLNWPLLDVVNTAVWTALLFLASVLLAALGDGGSGAHVAAVTLGFLALAAYALNVLLILRRRRRHRHGGGAAALGVAGVTAPGQEAPSPSAGDYTRARSDCADDAERPGVAPSASSQDWAVDDEEVAAVAPVPTALKL
ncbi:CKLF-like MARVEL transmembrane domain-containing protein 4 isoform X2 [Lampetra planeri]